MKKLIILFCMFPVVLFAQNCNCPESFQWMKKTFEENDAGFPGVVERKGESTYKHFSDSIQSLVAGVSDKDTCLKLMNTWLHFFRNGHMGVTFQKNTKAQNKTEKEFINPAEIEIYKIPDNPFHPEKSVENYHFGLTGIWENKFQQIGIFEDSTSQDRDYVAVVLQSNVDKWKRGMVKFSIRQVDGKYMCDYTANDFSYRTCPIRYSDLILRGDKIYWKRSPENFSTPDSLEISLLNTQKPQFLTLDENTNLIRIPSFVYKHKSAITKLVNTHQQKLDSCETLIIDVRQNGGGSDNSFRSLLPYIYTDTIKLYMPEIRSTPKNMEAMLSRNRRNFIGKCFNFFYMRPRLKKNMGSFVPILNKKFKTRTYAEVKHCPQKVYIIVDDRCASSTEQFLLYAEQSSKCVIIGEQTFGAIDISNVHGVDFPNGIFRLGYAISRSLRTHERVIDGIGIEPDVTIPDSVSKYRWAHYVLNFSRKPQEINR